MNSSTAGHGDSENRVKECAIEISGWATSHDIWKARASVVTMVPLAGKEALHCGFRDILLRTASTAIRNQERFVQLGAGMEQLKNVIIA
jgi:hypothetical protein